MGEEKVNSTGKSSKVGTNAKKTPSSRLKQNTPTPDQKDTEHLLLDFRRGQIDWPEGTNVCMPFSLWAHCTRIPT